LTGTGMDDPRELDEFLRRREFTISERPKYGPNWWQRKGRRYVEGFAVKLALGEVKELAYRKVTGH
jgi:hypothetical protein